MTKLVGVRLAQKTPLKNLILKNVVRNATLKVVLHKIVSFKGG